MRALVLSVFFAVCVLCVAADDDSFDMSNLAHRWGKLYGTVFVTYELAPEYDCTHRAKIKYSLEDFEEKTCITFVEKDEEDKDEDLKNYLYITSGEGCHGPIGKRGGKQVMSLNIEECMNQKDIKHVFMHALGFPDIHFHDLRDVKVTINYENIKEGKVNKFDRNSSNVYEDFGTAYDFNSIMHLDRRAFSKDGTDTIVPNNPDYLDVIGKSNFLSDGDLYRIREMYKCYEKITDFRPESVDKEEDEE